MFGTDRHRRALRARGAARAHAAVAGRRRHDPARELRQDHLQRACPTNSRPARRTSPAPSAWARRSISCETLDLGAAHAHEHALLEHATAVLEQDRGTAHHRHGERQGEPGLLRGRGRASRTISAPSSTRTASPSARAITAPCRSWTSSRLPATARASFAFYNTFEEIDRLARRRRTRPRAIRLRSHGTQRPVPRRDPGPQPPAAEFRPLEPADASAEGFNPLCGDRLTLRLKLDGDKIEDIRFEGQGCAISTASASLMTEAVKG